MNIAKRLSLKKLAALCGAAAVLTFPTLGLAQSSPATKINFTLDWRFEGPSAPFLMALEKGYFLE